MTTVLQVNARGFVNTPAVERIALRALRYLQSGFSVHLRGPAGTGKTTLALHLADLLGQPIMLIFGDDELKSSDLIGNQNGYTRKKVVDNFIHSVVKVEDELRQNWIDSRLTLACKEGFTLVYDEFNRSRPEVNNVLLSALEEKLLILPPNGNRSEYIRVHPEFRAIFTSNPEEYCGVYGTQDALLDRLVTINMPEPDDRTQQEILGQKINIDTDSAWRIVQIVKEFRRTVKQSMPETAHHEESAKHSSPLRSCLMIAKVSQEHDILVKEDNPDFRDLCADVLLSRTNLYWEKAREILLKLLDAKTTTASIPDGQSISAKNEETTTPLASTNLEVAIVEESNDEESNDEESNYQENGKTVELTEETQENGKQVQNSKLNPHQKLENVGGDSEHQVYGYLQKSEGMRVSQISQALGLNRFQTIDALRSLMKKGMLIQRDDRLYVAPKDVDPKDKES